MTEAEALPWLSIGISAVALVISAWSIIESRRAATKSNQTQAQMLRLETGRERDRRLSAKQAHVVAFVTGGSTDKRLFIRSQGHATARNVTVLLDGQSLEDHDLTLPPERPISVLGPDAEAAIVLAPHMGSQDGLHVTVTWDDESDERGQWESDLSLF